MLCSDIFPQLPAATFSRLGVHDRRMMIVTQRRIFGAGTIGDKNKIVFGKFNGFFLALLDAQNLTGNLFAAFEFKFYVGDLCIIFKLYVVCFQITDERQNQGFILIVFGEFECRKVRKSADVMDKTLDIQLHFQRRMPGLKGEHGAPVEPEVGLKEFRVEYIGDLFVVELFVWCHEQFDDAHSCFVRKSEFSIGVGIFAAVLCSAHQGIVWVALVQPVIFVQNRNVRSFDGWNRAEQVPQTFKVVFHFTAAADNKSKLLILNAVAGTARKFEFF